MITEYELYSDERKVAHAGSRYLFLGGVICTNNGRIRLQSELGSIRSKHGLAGEVKWGKASKHYLDAYREWIEAFFRDPFARYSALRINTSEKRWTAFEPRPGRRARSDDRLASAFYQFLLVTFGPLRDTKRWWVYPDSGFFSKESVLKSVEFLLNRTYKTAFGPKTSRIIRLARSLDSKRADLVQLADVLLAAESCLSLGVFSGSKPRGDLLRHYSGLRQKPETTQRGLQKVSLAHWIPPEKFVYPR